MTETQAIWFTALIAIVIPLLAGALHVVIDYYKNRRG